MGKPTVLVELFSLTLFFVNFPQLLDQASGGQLHASTHSIQPKYVDHVYFKWF